MSLGSCRGVGPFTNSAHSRAKQYGIHCGRCQPRNRCLYRFSALLVSFFCLPHWNRLIHRGITEVQWPNYLKEVFQILIPRDGWAQLVALGFPFAMSNNGTLPQDSALNKVCKPIDLHITNLLPDGSRLVMTCRWPGSCRKTLERRKESFWMVKD